jgi:drug/metabolite transporter (DMT)-like permease
MEFRMQRQTAIFLVLLSALGFGSIALFAKSAYGAGVSPTMLLAWRFIIAVAILAPVVWLRGLRLPRGKTLAGFALMGALYTAQSQSYFTALMHASSGLVGLLLYIYPVLVTMIAVALGWERLDRRTLVLLLLAIAGLAITLGGNLQGEPLGIALGILAAGVYAVYIVIGGKLTRDTDPLAATLVVMIAAGIGNGMFAIAGGTPLPQGGIAWLAIAAIALFSTVIAVGTFLIGIKVIGAAQASILSTLEPVITIVLGVAFLGEAVSASQMVGGAMVLAAVILLARRPQTAGLPLAEAGAEPAGKPGA